MSFNRAQIGGLIVTLRLPLAEQSPSADSG
jgi:hypothetical protein